MGKRVLVLGTTGIDKREVLNNLKNFNQFNRDKIVFEDFEKNYLTEEKSGYTFVNYLTLKSDVQHKCWKEGWNKFKIEKLDSNYYKSKDFFLCLHGILTTDTWGPRCPINFTCMQDFKPDMVITLIDDVYMHWHRTQKRSETFKPTIREHLAARYAEIMIGDLIAKHVEAYHYVLAVRHPVRTLNNLIYPDEQSKQKLMYLVFPIRKPRQDVDDMDEVNGFLKTAFDYQSKHPNLVCFCPLTIDELPLVKVYKTWKKDHPDEWRSETPIKFNLEEERWDLKKAFGDEKLLLNDIPKCIDIPAKQLEELEGILKDHLTIRDYKLVQQTGRLGVFNAVWRGKQRGGTAKEINHALKNGFYVHAYQDPKHLGEVVPETRSSYTFTDKDEPTYFELKPNEPFENIFKNVLGL